MTPVLILGVLAGACAVCGAITAGRMGQELQRRGIAVNWFLMRIQMIRWVSRYKKLTTEELGRPGPLYGQFLIAMNLALVLAILALLARRFG
jgi:hypothetical protein